MQIEQGMVLTQRLSRLLVTLMAKLRSSSVTSHAQLAGAAPWLAAWLVGRLLPRSWGLKHAWGKLLTGCGQGRGRCICERHVNFRFAQSLMGLLGPKTDSKRNECVKMRAAGSK